MLVNDLLDISQIESGRATLGSGRELFFRAGNSMMSAPVETTPTFSAGTPTKLFERRFSGLGRTYDVSRDGQRFLVITDNAASQQTTAGPSMVIVLDWFDELKAKVPSGRR